MKLFKIFKSVALSIVLSTAAVCIKGQATISPIPVSGRVLRADKRLGDNSDWMEVARLNGYSLIVRMNCLSEKTTYSNSNTYNGYLNSNVKQLMDRWFLTLDDGLLKRLAVGNDAEANLGCFDSLDCTTYQYNNPGELQGSGISLPDFNKPPSPFALSFQEARKFLFSQADLRHSDPAAYANYLLLAGSRKRERFYLRFIPAGTDYLPIEASWLRSPSSNLTSASCSGKMNLAGRTLFCDNLKKEYGIRPAMWVHSSIFAGVNPVHIPTELIESMNVDENAKTKIINLLSCEYYYKNMFTNCELEYDRPKYFVMFSNNPGMEDIKKFIGTYNRMGIIPTNAIVHLGQTDLTKLNIDDLEQLLRSKLENASGGSLIINVKNVFDFTSEEDFKLKFEKFIKTLSSSSKCLVVMTNCTPRLKEYISKDQWESDIFEMIDLKEEQPIPMDECQEKHVDIITKPTIEECMKPLDSLVGMNDFKELVKGLLRDFKIFEIDSKMGIERERPRLHMILMGNPGTGKTTVAQTLGDILFNAGIIKRNKVIKVERADLVGKYQGHTEAFVKSKLKEAEGGILFIDEAYSLAAGGNRDFGQRVIEGLLTPLTTDDCIIIVAGYVDEMQKFLRSNSGLSGRFNHKVILKDYTAEELLEIFENLCKKSNFTLEEGAGEYLLEIFRNLSRESNFSNARCVRKVYDDIMRIRSMSLTIDIDVDDLTESEIRDRKTIKTEYIEKLNEELKKSKLKERVNL